MANKLHLLVHPLCPFAQRAIFVREFKQIDCVLETVSVVNKSDRLLSVNPTGKVPALEITTSERKYNLYESLVVAEYLDSFPGPSLYPRGDPIESALLKKELLTQLDPMIPLFFRPLLQDLEVPEEFISRLKHFDDSLGKNRYYMDHVSGNNNISMADIVLYIIMERMNAIKIGPFVDLVESYRLYGLKDWFDSMNQLSWVQNGRAGDTRLHNMAVRTKNGEIKGLDLPLSIFD